MRSFFHLGVNGFSGGFVGVDIFFVISGYLITKLIKEQVEAGTFSFGNFYIRRVRRLFLALFVTLLVSLLVAISIFSPNDLQRTSGALLHSLASISNFYFWIESDYFDVASKLKPLLHTWSLSVEEQFYLIWPAVLVFLLKFKRADIVILFLMVVLSLLGNQFFYDGQLVLIDKLNNKSSYFVGLIKSWTQDGHATIFYLLPFTI